jgi:S-DNA-T family DNA segregation ATPase FtsK/SpoIIIE
VETLAADVDAAALPPGRRGDGATELVVGVEFHSLAPATLIVPDGEHVLVAGPPRSGRSTALLQLARSWSEAHPNGLVHAAVATAEGLVAAVQAARPDRPCLVLVDDADGVDDDSGALAGLLAKRRPGLVVVAAGRPPALRAQYGQWTNVVRRSRLGLLMAACVDTDGDVLGELLPRRPPIPPRPGLAWVVAGGQRLLVQVGRGPSERAEPRIRDGPRPEA